MAETRRRTGMARLKLLTAFRQLDEAAQRKFMKYAISGIVIAILGLLLIVVGLGLGTGNYASEGLLVGFGSIIVLIGIIRILIGFINPMSPKDLDRIVETESPQEMEAELHSEIFEEQHDNT